MFFMVTYGAICLVSLFEHFAASPSYRPTFRSHWFLSLIGAFTCFYLMFLMNFSYAVGSIVIMAVIYVGSPAGVAAAWSRCSGACCSN